MVHKNKKIFLRIPDVLKVIAIFFAAHYILRMNLQLNTPIGRLRVLALLEGISYLLFGITMPLKYGMEITEPNLYVGMTHGWLFIIYVIICIQCIMLYDWKVKTSLLALVASLIPFGTFVADAKIFKPESRKA